VSTLAPLSIAATLHEIKNLLLVAELSAQWLRPSCGDRARTVVDEMESAIHRAGELSRHLLQAARASADAAQPAMADTCDLVQLLRGLSEVYARLIEPHARLVAQLDPATAVVRAPAAVIERVVRNLILNARDAAPGGTVWLLLDGDGDRVRLRVRDDGCGIAAADQERIFQPFFTTKGDRGTGLGLYAVHSDVAAVGGSVSVDSRPGEGATFAVTLPRAVTPLDEPA
jgi:two-component system cell cycle sensor histidine kinase/response regulator CckA